MNRLRHRLRSIGVPEDWGPAFLVMFLGTVIWAISIFDSREKAFPSGRLPAYLAGWAFFAFGLAIFVRSARPLIRERRVVGWIGVFLVLLASVPFLGLAFHRGILPGFRKAPAPPVFEAVTLRTDSEEVRAGEMIHVTFDREIRVPEGYQPFVCVVSPASAVGTMGRFAYIGPGATEARVQAPGTPGIYEIRLHPHMNAVVGACRVVVRPGRAEQEEPPVEEPAPGPGK